jgi:hypothetical protein
VERFEAEFDQNSSRCSVIVGVSSSQPHKAGIVECKSNYSLGGLERIAYPQPVRMQNGGGVEYLPVERRNLRESRAG